MMRNKAVITIAICAMVLLFASSVSAATYTVQPGDTLYLIAKRYGTNYQSLASTNGLSSTTIYVGQTLVIPSNNNNNNNNNNNGNLKYIVQPGDSLFLIGNKYQTTSSEIMALNGLNTTIIYPGQSLNIPASRSSGTASRGSFSWRDIELLARVVNGEARGESFVGQVAVAAVVLNRVKSNLFPNSIAGVVYQPWAFTCVHDGQINAPITSSAMEAARAALNGWDPTNGALYYWNPITATSSWIWTRPIRSQIGRHVFAR